MITVNNKEDKLRQKHWKEALKIIRSYLKFKLLRLSKATLATDSGDTSEVVWSQKLKTFRRCISDSEGEED
jgi:GTP-binding protein EngB required for normal cell division